MRVLYYKISLFPGSEWNIYDCPIKYYLKKYNLGSNIPVPKRCSNGEYIACFPEEISYVFTNILKEQEDCSVFFLKEEITLFDNLEKVYVNQLFENINGINTIDYFLLVGVNT